MGGGMSSNKFREQESYVSLNLDKEKKRMSRYKNYDGKNRYSDDQIRMKLRQDYNSKGYTKRIDRDDFICHAHWHVNR